MKKITKVVGMGLLASIIFSGCTPVLYSNVGQNVPMFTQKNEIAGSVNYGISGSEVFSIMGAYAVSDKWAAIASYYSISGMGSGDYDWSSKGSYFEMGGGRYGTFSNATFAYEIFGGIGFSGVNNTRKDDVIKANYVKPFIQPSVGIISKHAEIIFTPRIAYVGYTNSSCRTGDAMLRNQVDNYFNSNGSKFVFEPGVTMRLGFEKVKFQFQANHSFFNATRSEDLYPVEDNFMSVGLFLLISNRYDNKK
jgi:hypothetical protein